MTEAQGPPRGSAPNGLPSLATSADHRLEAVLLHEGEMLGEALVAARCGTWRRPPASTGPCSASSADAATPNAAHRTAAHAAAHEMRALDAEMVEQALALRHVVRPGHALDAAARLAAFAAVEHDAGVVLRQMIEQLDLGVDALRRPFLDRARRSRPARTSAAAARSRSPRSAWRCRRWSRCGMATQPLIWRPARASAISAVKASSAALAALA